MDQKSKEELSEFFAEAFREVVLPSLDNMQEDLEDIKTRVGRIENKLDKMDDRFDRHGVTLDDHEKRIERLEAH